MGGMNGISDCKISSALDYASGTAARTGAIIDMRGFLGVLMIVKFATIADGAVTVVKAQEGAAANLSDVADLEGSGIAVEADDDDQLFALDIYQPNERYVRLAIEKDGANATAESAVYIQYGATYQPVDNTAANLLTYERHMSPAEGVS
jgi:hypothetical protein